MEIKASRKQQIILIDIWFKRPDSTQFHNGVAICRNLIDDAQRSK